MAVHVVRGPGAGWRAEADAPHSASRTCFGGGAVLSGMQLRDKFPGDEVALGFPTVDRYRALHASVGDSLRTLRIQVLFVDEEGHVAAQP